MRRCVRRDRSKPPASRHSRQLGDLPSGTPRRRDPPESLERIRHQAELQLRGRREGRYCWEIAARRGRARLPPAPARAGRGRRLVRHGGPPVLRDQGAGSSTCSATATATTPATSSTTRVWGRDRDGERGRSSGSSTGSSSGGAATRGMHVYHYAAYERTALTRLMGEHGTRESEIDDIPSRRGARRPLPGRQAGASRIGGQLLDQGDREALRVRAHGRRRRAATSRSSASRSGSRPGTTRSWRRSSATTRRTAVRRSRSTSGCFRIRPPDRPWRDPPELRPPTEEAIERDAERAALEAALLAGAEEGSPRRLLGNLVDYHQREARPQWWAWFRWPQLDDDELVADRTAIGRLVLGRGGARDRGSEPRVPDARSRRRSTSSRSRASTQTRGHGFRLRVDDDAGRRHAAAVRRARGGAAPPRADAGWALPRRGQARGAAALRPRVRGRRSRPLPGTDRARSSAARPHVRLGSR